MIDSLIGTTLFPLQLLIHLLWKLSSLVMNPGDTWLEETHLELNMRFVYQLEHHEFAG